MRRANDEKELRTQAQALGLITLSPIHYKDQE